MPTLESPSTTLRTLSRRQATVLLASVFLIAGCGLLYELIVGTLSSYLFGNSVAHFSVTIGLFMSAMGIGSFLSRRITRRVLAWFVGVELAVGVLGGASAMLLYAVFTATPFYHAAMVVLILAIGTLIGLEIPLVIRLLGGRAALKDTLAHVFTFDYLGALIASLLFPLVLLPWLGLMRTAFVTGLVNLAVVAVVLVLFRQELRAAGGGLRAACGIGGLALAAGLVGAAPLTGLFEQRLYRDTIVYSDQTPYQRLVMTRWGDDLRLYIDGNLQFSTRDEHRYHELLVHPALTLTASREAVLILGGGDGLAAREVLKYPDVQRVVLVDLDPAVTELARSHRLLRAANADALADPRVEVVHADAYRYLEETSERFGAILIDLPDPNNESLAKLYANAFYRLARRHLAVGGLLATQATSPYFARRSYWSIVGTIASEGLAVTPYHAYIPSFGDWGFVLAGERPFDWSRFDLSVPTRYLTPELMAAARLFDSDTDAVDAAINTLDDPVLLTYYSKGWDRWE